MKSKILLPMMFLLLAFSVLAETKTLTFNDTYCAGTPTCTNVTYGGNEIGLNHSPSTLLSDNIVWQVDFGSHGLTDLKSNTLATNNGDASWYAIRGTYFYSSPTTSDDYLNWSTYDPGANDVSIGAWIRVNGATDANVPLFGIKDGFTIGLNGSKVYVYSNATGAFENTTALTTDEWANVVAVYNHSDIKLYINGVLSQTVAGTANIASGALILGRNLSLSYDASIAAITMWNTSLSATNVTTYYNEKLVSHASGIITDTLNFTNSSDRINVTLTTRDTTGTNPDVCFRILNETTPTWYCDDTNNIALTTQLNIVDVEYRLTSTAQNDTVILISSALTGFLYVPPTAAQTTCATIAGSVYDAFDLAVIALIVLAASIIITVLIAAFGGGAASMDMKTLTSMIVVIGIFVLIGTYLVAKVAIAIC